MEMPEEMLQEVSEELQPEASVINTIVFIPLLKVDH